MSRLPSPAARPHAHRDGGVALPAAFGLLALAEPVIDVSFERGAFGRDGVERTTLALQVLSVAILPAGATGLIARTYYSMGDFMTPVRVSAAMLVLNVVLNAWFLVGLGMDVEGPAAATVITSSLNAVILLPGLRSKLGLPASRERFLVEIARVLAATAVSVAYAYVSERFASELMGRSFALALGIGVGIATYLVVARWLGVEIARRVVDKLRRRVLPR